MIVVYFFIGKNNKTKFEIKWKIKKKKFTTQYGYLLFFIETIRTLIGDFQSLITLKMNVENIGKC